MFQLKFCLKTFQTCSLLYLSILKCSILAMCFVQILVIRSKYQEWRTQMVQGAKIFQGRHVTSYIPRLFLSIFFPKMDVFLNYESAEIKVFIIVYSKIL